MLACVTILQVTRWLYPLESSQVKKMIKMILKIVHDAKNVFLKQKLKNFILPCCCSHQNATFYIMCWCTWFDLWPLHKQKCSKFTLFAYSIWKISSFINLFLNFYLKSISWDPNRFDFYGKVSSKRRFWTRFNDCRHFCRRVKLV